MADATTRGTGRYRLRPRESEAPDAEQILRRWQTLRSRRANVDEVQQELADYIIPRKAVITEHHGGSAVGRVEGEELTEHVWDSTAIRANELLAARIQGALTSPSIRWFSLKTRDARMNEQYAVRRWLNDVEDRMYLALRQSNFNAEMGEVYLDLGALGTGAMLIESEETDEGNRGFWFRALAPGTYCIAEDSRGRVDTLFRIIKMTLRQCAQQFSVDALPQAWREQLDREPDAEREVLHAIQSRRVDNPKRKDVLHFPVASVFLAVSEKVILEEGGYKEFPGVVPRWSKTSGEVYGRGPGHTALPDIRTLNKAVELTLSSAAKALDPPGLVSSDATIAELDLRPGSMNTVEGDPRLAWAPLESGAKFDVSKLLEGDLREAIRNTFYWDQLQLQSQRVMTATEVQSRLEIMQQFLAPTLARLESEALTPLLNRCFSIMHRQGELPPPPEELRRGANLDVEYEGPLARSQKVTRLAGMDEFIRVTAPVAQQQPAVVDNLDTDRAFRDLAEVAGLPADYLRDEDDVATMRQQRAQQQQLAKQMEVAMGASEMGRNLAPVMEAAQGIPPDQMAGAAGGGGDPMAMLQQMMSGQNGAAGPPR
jgi:hypothetical protein